jgi:hypothetical protein
MARLLSKVQINGTTYYIDERCHELRNVDEPADSLQFETSGDLLVFLGQYADWETLVPGIVL